MAGGSTELHRARPGWFAIVAAAAGLVLVWLALRAIWGGKIRPGLLDERSDQIPNQPLAVVLSEQLPVRREVIGSVQSRVPVEAASRVAARVTEVKVHAGDRVGRGQILVTLDSSDLRAQVAQAQGQLTAAQADLARTRADEKRFSALFARGSVTAREHDAAEAAYTGAAGRVAQARAGLGAAQAGLEYATVRSPVAGVVVERLTEPGDLAMPGKTLVRLYDETALRVQLEVPEDLARYIALGTFLDVSVVANGATYHTPVNEIVPASDPSSRIVLIRASLPSGQGLQPGMFARASFTAGAETVLTVPRDAIQEVGQLETARIVSDGKVETRMVSLGRSLDRRVEVLSGLRAGDRVVLDHAPAQGQ
jgi:RND family efflux transporter MFP subunit